MKGTLPGVDVSALTEFRDALLEVDPDLEDFSYSAESYDAIVVMSLAAIAAGSDDGVAMGAEITVITRKAYGGAYVVMSSKHLRGDVNYAWPTSEIAVMGAKGATEILYRSELGDPDKIAAPTAEYEDRFANTFVAAERGFLNQVIIPRSTRPRWARDFAALPDKTLNQSWKDTDTIPP